MVLRRSTLTLIFVYIILFFALHAKPISSHGKEEIPAPSLPKLGVQKSSIDQNNDGIQRAIRRLEVIKGALEEYIPWLAIKKDCWVTPPEQKPCCDQCQENYGVALDCAKRSIESINKQDLPKAKCDINGITTNMQTCSDCFVALGNGEENIKAINLWAKQATQECLDCLKTTENGVQKLSVDQNDKEEFPAPSLPKLGVQKSSIDQNNDGTQTAIVQLEVIKGALEKYIPWLANKKACWQTPPEAKPCCDQCQENYGVALDCVKRSIESINKQDLPKAKCDINGIATNMQTCYDCFVASGNGEDHVKTINLWAKQATEECLDSLKTAENGVQKLSVGQNDKGEPPAPSLPKLGVQKSSINQNNDGTQTAITRLEVIKGALEEYIPWLAIKKDCWVTPPEQKPCCDQCQENYGVALDCAKRSIESINKQDIPKAKCDINGIATNVQTCSDCFVALGNREENIKAINFWAKKATQECLDSLKTAENGVQKLSVDQNDKEEIPVAPSLPKIGVQKSSVDQNNEAAKVTIARLEGIKPHIEAYKEFFGSRKACGLTPPEGKKCCGQCQKNLADAIKGVKVSIASVKKQDYPKANGDISGIATDIQKCNDCFVQTPNGEDSCAKKFYVWAKEATDDCLVHLKNAEIESQEL